MSDWTKNKAEYLFNNLKHSLAEPATVKSAIEQALQDAFTKGMMHASVPRDRVKAYGTADCMRCVDGRMTIYSDGECIECYHERISQNDKTK